MATFGQPEDLGPLAVYLASDASRFMTGAALIIDGGYLPLVASQPDQPDRPRAG